MRFHNFELKSSQYKLKIGKKTYSETNEANKQKIKT